FYVFIQAAGRFAGGLAVDGAALVWPRKTWVCRRDKQQQGREGRSVMVCVSVDVGCVKKIKFCAPLG
ncbi:hypothetical protein ACTVMJ_27210, partial [Serratia marcescens]